MDKKKTSKKQEILSKSIGIKPITLKNEKGISKFDHVKIMLDEKLLAEAILECFKDDDPDALIEILDGYIFAYNKTKFAKEAKISRSTLYDMLRGKKNPTLRVFIKCVHKLVSEPIAK